jgi:hypothetical protein
MASTLLDFFPNKLSRLTQSAVTKKHQKQLKVINLFFNSTEAGGGAGRI